MRHQVLAQVVSRQNTDFPRVLLRVLSILLSILTVRVLDTFTVLL